jgi:hypothetical protein
VLEAQDAGDVAPADRAHLDDLAVDELDAVILVPELSHRCALHRGLGLAADLGWS